MSIQRGLFNTRSRVQHARKRKIVSNIFAQKNVLEFEPHVRDHLGALFQQWDKLCDGGKKGLSGTEGEGGWHGSDGRVWYDCLPWYNYLAFDIIGKHSLRPSLLPFHLATIISRIARLAERHST